MNILIASHFIFFTLFYLWGLKKNDFSVADIAWGLSFVLIFAVGGYLNFETLGGREKLVGICVLIWALRLSGYIAVRNFKSGKEDSRYTEMRQGWGKNEKITAYFRVFLLQGLLSLLIGYPLFLLHSRSSSVFGEWTDVLGLCFFLLGFSWETIADYQKNKFKKEEKDNSKLCQVGLWKYSRYPNYFGELTLWWGITLVISSVVSFYLIAWGPLLLSFFIIKVSGVAMLDKKYKSRPGFAEYKETTNTLIPWFPKNS